MLFNSFHFIVFFIIVTIGYYILPQRWRWILLLISSYYFYMCWNPIFILLIVFSTFINYIFSLTIAKEKDFKKRKKYLLVTIAINFGLLFLFKYAVFFNESILSALGSILQWWYRDLGAEGAMQKAQQILQSYPAKDFDIMLPMGISFYTFQAASYTMDVYRADVKPVRHYGMFSLFITFFPQLVAGPIERSSQLLPQFYKKHYFEKERVLLGLKWMLWGFFKKMVIADRVAVAVDTIYASPQSYSGLYLFLAMILFTFQIYCDFSGYSDIALGSAKVLGFDLMMNFNKPYLSKSIKEFWRRWHVSLSTWFMDYVYIPLGGNRKGKARQCWNLFITFLVSGLWHGANWTYAVWGGLHGVYLVVGRWTENVRKKIRTIFHLEKNIFWSGWNILCTFLLFSVSLVIFRANTVSDAVYVLRHMTDDFLQWREKQYVYEVITSMGVNLFEFLVICISIGFLVLAEIATGKESVVGFIEKRHYIVRLVFYVFVSVWVLATGVFYAGGEFIYFQF